MDPPAEEYRMILQNLLHTLDRQLQQKIFTPGHDIRLADWIEVAHKFEKSIIQDLKPVIVSPGNYRTPSSATPNRQNAQAAYAPTSSAPTINNFATLPIEIADDEDDGAATKEDSPSSRRKRTRNGMDEESPTKRIKEEPGIVGESLTRKIIIKVLADNATVVQPRPCRLGVNAIKQRHRQICPTFNDNVEVDRRIIPALFKPSTEYWGHCTEALMKQTVSMLEAQIRKVTEHVFQKWAHYPILQIIWGEIKATLAEMQQEELQHAMHRLEIEREVHFSRRSRQQLQSIEGDEYKRLREHFNKAAGPAAAAAAATNRQKEKEKEQGTLADSHIFELTIMAKLGVYYNTAATRYVDSVILSVNGGMFVKCLGLIRAHLDQMLDLQASNGKHYPRNVLSPPGLVSVLWHGGTRNADMVMCSHS